MKYSVWVIGALIFGAIWPQINTVRAVNYYVSPSGNDANSGTSVNLPWKTNNRINTTVFHPGDKILFEGGKTTVYANDQAVVFTSEDSGTEIAPIIIDSYGTGKATLSAASGGGGIAIFNAGGFEIRNIILNGNGRTMNMEEGIKVFNTPPTSGRLNHIYIDNVEVSGFGTQGIVMYGEYGQGFNDVKITNCQVHDNGIAGIEMQGKYDPNNMTYAHSNVYVGHNTAYNNSGITGQNSGSGIVIWQTDGGMIERNSAYNNGWLGGTASGGPVGIWAFASRNITIQYNESHHNRTGGAWDGGGFDFDAGTINSVMQYNYAHDNDGPGYLLAQPAVGAAYHDNTLRYNISENDGRTNSGALGLWNAGSGITNIEIYNNTIYMTPNTSGDAAAVKFKTGSTNVHMRNNIFMSTGSVPVLDVAAGQSGLLLQGNDYWNTGGSLIIKWQGATYNQFNTWQTTTGQEILNGQRTGYNTDPLVTQQGNGGTIGNPDLLKGLTAYRLQKLSPLIDRGLDLKMNFGISPGTNDFFETLIPFGNGFDVGANEYTGQKAGDANGDGVVDGMDYVIWLNHYNQSVSGSSYGDFDGNGRVDGIDYTIWLNNYDK